MLWLKVLFIFISVLYLQVVDGNPRCDELDYYNPYARIFKRRNGQNPTAELNKAGFLDLTLFTSSILCINGPAILYYGAVKLSEIQRKLSMDMISSDEETVLEVDDQDGTSDKDSEDVKREKLPTEHENDSKKTQSEKAGKRSIDNGNKAAETHMRYYEMYKNGQLKIYDHKCFTINRLSKEEITKRRSDPTRAAAGISNSSKIISKPVYGVFLFGKEGDYREPAVYQFLDPAFGHLVYGISKSVGNSFVVIGGKGHDWCLKSRGIEIVLSCSEESPSVCKYGGGHAQFDKLFPVGTKLSEFQSWRRCNIKDVEPSTEKVPTTYENFSSIDPAAANNKVSKPIKHPFPETVPEFMDTSMLEDLHLEPSFFPTTTTPPPVQNISSTNKIQYPPPKCRNGSSANSKLCKIPMTVCRKLPVYNPNNCLGSIDQISSPIGEPCAYLDAVLNLTELVNDTIIDTNEIDPSIEWKQSIILRINSIYNKICFKVNPEMAPSVGRMVMYYLNQRYLRNTDETDQSCVRSEAWKFLDSELKLCDKCANEMQFLWTHKQNDGELKRRKREGKEGYTHSSEQLEVLEEPQDPDNYVFPEEVRVILDDDFDEVGDWDKAAPVDYYHEAAELDFELNIPIDLHYKVFATVAGYCNLHYSERKSETFPRLYTTYYEDILGPLEDIWMHPTDQAITKRLFDEYTDEPVVKWIDSCLEGSYLVSNSSTFRPIRPLNIPEGDTTVSNYYLDDPPSHNVRIVT